MNAQHKYEILAKKKSNNRIDEVITLKSGEDLVLVRYDEFTLFGSDNKEIADSLYKSLVDTQSEGWDFKLVNRKTKRQ